MPSPSKQPTATGRVILDRLAEQSWSIAEIERRTPLTKNTISNAIYGPRQPQRKTIEILAGALDLPIEALTRPEPPDSMPPSHETPAPVARFEHFGEWLFRRANASLWIALGGTAITVWLLFRGLDDDHVSPWVPGVHFAVILVLLARLPRAWVGPRLLDDAPIGRRIALTAAADLRRYWGAVWLFWLVLYGFLTVGSMFGWMAGSDAVASPTGRWLTVALDLAQNGATVMLFLAYEVVARPTVAADLSRKQVLPLEAWLTFAFLPPLLEAGLVLLDQPWAVQQGFGWFSGFAQGTALALLVGRLDSKTIGPPTWVIASLYVYAAIQGAWPVFQTHPALMSVLTVLALALKCLLFLFVEWLFASRVLLYYLERLRVLDDEVRRSRREFLAETQADLY
ncbi:MAG: helix-turn-helix transcriptional regulator [Acidobacteriota bacterium]